jgi:acyl-CoA synthetase (AMP-forming)/AMP-acid ligase II
VIGYSSTEAAIATGTVPGDSPEVISRTVGRARVNVELELVDDDGTPVKTGAVGRVRVRSEAVMRGYWEDPERTEDVLDAEGWLTLGDLGSLDEDGYLTLVGRKSEMYIRGGYNVYPAEVEAALTDHPAIDRVGVVGTPDDVLGEIGVAFVVPAAGADVDTLSLDALRAWSRERIADYKSPDRVVLVDDLPVTPMMKIDKAALAEQARVAPARRERSATA